MVGDLDCCLGIALKANQTNTILRAFSGSGGDEARSL